jgi:hypothetical protein
MTTSASKARHAPRMNTDTRSAQSRMRSPASPRKRTVLDRRDLQPPGCSAVGGRSDRAADRTGSRYRASGARNSNVQARRGSTVLEMPCSHSSRRITRLSCRSRALMHTRSQRRSSTRNRHVTRNAARAAGFPSSSSIVRVALRRRSQKAHRTEPCAGRLKRLRRSGPLDLVGTRHAAQRRAAGLIVEARPVEAAQRGNVCTSRRPNAPGCPRTLTSTRRPSGEAEG